LTEALGVDVKDPEHASRLKVDQTLQDVFDGVFPPRPTKKSATKDEEAKANDLKDEGLDCTQLFHVLHTSPNETLEI